MGKEPEPPTTGTTEARQWGGLIPAPVPEGDAAFREIVRAPEHLTEENEAKVAARELAFSCRGGSSTPTD